MAQVCFYFLLHQPYRLTDFSVLDLGVRDEYFQTETYDQNREVFLKVTKKCYQPMLSLLLKLVKRQSAFKFSFSTSGVFLEQAQKWAPEVIEILQELSCYPEQVEIIGENYYHSLSALYSEQEFAAQVKKHECKLWELFQVKPKVFRNTEMIYNNYIAYQVARLGYQGMLTEAVDRCLQGRNKGQVYKSNCQPSIPLLLKNAQLSDDIAFRFSQKSWASWPLTSEKYLTWLSQYGHDEIVGLFMDFETFGEHQWASTGIFEFFEALIDQGVTQPKISFVLPSEKLANKAGKQRQQWLEKLPIYDVEEPISWADEHRDLSAWRENALQLDTLKKIYELEAEILLLNQDDLTQCWRKLQTSDHYYYMCTKYFADGDVHAYFSAYDSPLEAYRRFCVVLSDLTHKVKYAKKVNHD